MFQQIQIMGHLFLEDYKRVSIVRLVPVGASLLFHVVDFFENNARIREI